MYSQYTELDDLEERLDRAIEEGVLTEQEAREEWLEAIAEERACRGYC